MARSASAAEAARSAMDACRASGVREAPRPRDPRACSSVTPEELAELARIPGNEGVRVPSPPAATAAGPSPARPMRVLVRLDPVPGVPMVARETLAIFVDTHDPEMAESVAEAALHARGLAGEVVS